MPGLFGIILKKPGLSERGLRSMGRRMADSMRRVPWLHTDIWGDSMFCGGRVHLGILNPQAQPLTREGNSIRLWFDGETYPTSAESGATPTAEEVAELVSGAGAGLAEIDGIFNLACYDPDKRELILANDRLGFRPLYYTESEEYFAYAAEVKALLAIRSTLPDLDEISLRQFFGFGYMLGERTWWKGIELIPPATVRRISTKGRTSSRYWSFDEIRRDPRDEADVLVEFGRLWSQSVQQRSKPGIMPLLLSGGLDSRLLLAELRAQGADLVTITFGSKDCPDMKIAQQCAKIAGVPHRPLYLNAANWWHGREEAIWQTDGVVNGLHLHVAIALDELHIGTCYTLKNSTGDTLFGGSKLGMKASPDWSRSPRYLLEGMYIANPFFRCKEVVDVSIGDCDRYMYGPSTDCFVISQRQRRMILTGPGAMAAYCEVVNPGISLPLLRLVLGSLSDEQRRESKFYNRFLASRYPAYFCDIPWQKTGRGLAESLPIWISRGVRGRVAKLTRRVPGAWRIGERVQPVNKGFANYAHFLHASKTREKLLGEELLLDEFLRGAVRRVLENPAQAPLLKAQVITAILTFETYLRQVVGIPSLTGLPSCSPGRSYPVGQGSGSAPGNS